MKLRRRNLSLLMLPGVAAGIIVIGLLVRLLPDTGSAAPLVPQTGPATTTASDRFDVSFAHGVALLRQGRASEAMASLRSATEARPSIPEAHVNLGFAYLDLGRVDDAVAAFERSLALRPGQLNAYYGLAESLERRGDLEGALGAMRTYIHLAPESDPYRRKAMSAVWEWEAKLGATRVAESPRTSMSAHDVSLHGDSKPEADMVFASSLEALSGARATLEPYAGKAIVLNLWATWCPPCRAELPSLQRLSQKLDPSDAVVIGVSIDDDADFVREFLKELSVDYPSFLDRKRELAAALHVASYPQTLLISADGRVRQRIFGERKWDADDFALVEAILPKREASKQ